VYGGHSRSVRFFRLRGHIKPANLIGGVFVDIGLDVVPFEAAEFEFMAGRCSLTHGRLRLVSARLNLECDQSRTNVLSITCDAISWSSSCSCACAGAPGPIF